MANCGAHAEAEDNCLRRKYLIVGKVADAKAGSDSKLGGADEETQPDLAVTFVDQKRKHSDRAEHIPTDKSNLHAEEAQEDTANGVGEDLSDASADVVDEDVALEILHLEADLIVAEGDDGPLYKHDDQVA